MQDPIESELRLLHVLGLFDYSALWRLGSGMIMANMGFKSLVALHSKFCFVSSSDLPVGGPERWNTHAQLEQVQPWRMLAALYVKLRL